MATTQNNFLNLQTESFTIILPYERLTIYSNEKKGITPQTNVQQEFSTTDIRIQRPTGRVGCPIERVAMLDAKKQERMNRQAAKREQVMLMQQKKQEMREQRMAQRTQHKPFACAAPGMQKKRAMMLQNQNTFEQFHPPHRGLGSSMNGRKNFCQQCTLTNC